MEAGRSGAALAFAGQLKRHKANDLIAYSLIQLSQLDYRLLDHPCDLSTVLSCTLVTEVDEVRTLNSPGVSMPT